MSTQQQDQHCNVGATEIQQLNTGRPNQNLQKFTPLIICVGQQMLSTISKKKKKKKKSESQNYVHFEVILFRNVKLFGKAVFYHLL